MRNIWNTRYAGQIAGSVQHGYIKINFERRFFYAHRLAWFLVHGKDTASQIDHIDGDRLNNRISNLRVASNAENQANARRQSNNTTGIKGVVRIRNGRYRAEITHDYRNINLGHFDTLEEAATVRRDAAERLHGEFARHK